MEQYKVIHGNMLEELPKLEAESFDVCITDPPYELNFMGKGWDNSGVAFQKETWEKVFRVLKHGAYLVAFGGTRTYHRIACAIEDAGFEIRDCMMYLYGSGFPKSLNVGLAVDKELGQESEVIGRVKGSGSTGINEAGNHQFVAKNQYADGTYDLKKGNNRWAGYGTQLKPAYEPIIIARKPIEQTIAKNVLKYGCGAINIDAGRIGTETVNIHNAPKGTFAGGASNRGSDTETYRDSIGRFPANVIHDGSEEAISGFPNSDGSGGKPFKATDYKQNETATNFNRGDFNPYNDSGSASRYFYCAKASKKDRDEGLEAFELKQCGSIAGGDNDKEILDDVSSRFRTFKKNTHPTVKPIELMQYLIRLFAPEGAKILDCFAGSGSTGKAAMFENRERNTNYTITLVEMTAEYIPIIKARCDYAINKYEYDLKLKEEKTGQMNLFDFTEGD